MSINSLFLLVAIDFAIFLAAWHILERLKTIEQNLTQAIASQSAYIGQLEDEVAQLRNFYSDQEEGICS